MLYTPIIKVKGSPYECGLQHGSKAKNLIDHNLKFYGRYFSDLLKIEWDDAKLKIKNSISLLEKYYPEILKELEGIAAGSEKSLEDIVVLNARYELAITSIAGKYLEGCTSYAFTPQVTKSGHVLIGQNWDFMHGLKDSCIFLLIEQEKGPKIAMHVEAGMVGHKGLNSAGIGLCINALISNKDKIQPAVPLITVISRKIMNSTRIRDALSAIFRAERSASINFMIAHSAGEILNLEITPDDVAVTYPSQGILTHSNNFLEFNPNIKDLGKIFFPDSITRWHRMKELLKPKIGKIEQKEIKKAASDHFDHPYSICRHIEEHSDTEYGFETILSIIMDLKDKNMYVTEGNPCSNKYERVTLEF
jgi:isopenicillin-N N-acyltransferase-like protein